jgi:hypothetical protein
MNWGVSPQKGNTTTDFLYTAIFQHNEEPTQMNVEIDGVNHTLEETDPEDDVLQDGKQYSFQTKLPIGNHRYRIFAKADGWSAIDTEFVNFPWVNISLKNPQVIPTVGYVTSNFKFSVDYGSVFNKAPDYLYVDTGSRRFDLSRSSPTPNYLKGDVRFEADVEGLDLLPAPLTYYINVTTGPDSYSLGPFEMDGPSMDRVNLTGTVTDLEMIPLVGATITVQPGNISGSTDELGKYSLELYKGRDYRITYSSDGFLDRSYTIDLMQDRRLDITLEPLPEGSSVHGYVLTESNGQLVPVEGVEVNLTGPLYSNRTISAEDGGYVLGDIPAANGYVLTARGERFQTFDQELNVSNSVDVLLNITMIERDMGVSVTPDPLADRIPVTSFFDLVFPLEPDVETLDIKLSNGSSEVSIEVLHEENSTYVTIVPERDLMFDTLHTLVLSEGVYSVFGNIMVWRELEWDYRTMMQDPLEEPVTHPSPDQISVPLDIEVRISWGIGLNMSSFEVELIDLDTVQPMVTEVLHQTTVNWSDSGRTDTWITIVPSNLSYNTRYSLEVEGGLKDIYERTLFSNSYSLEFFTVGEPDRDGDGYPDSLDDFPDDPDEWTDLDNDGYGDQTSDRFPEDPNEWADTDGDGIGDNEDTDDDNDGMPDIWEEENGLDPKDPADAFLDPDDDGYTNLEEYREGTDPQDGSSKPKESSDGVPPWVIVAGIIVLILIAVIVVFLVLRSKESPHSEE